MRNKIQRSLWGIVLIVIGGLWLASNFIPGFALDFSVLWPVFMLVPGLAFWIMFLMSPDKKEKAGLMIPANILVFLSLTFWVNIFLSDSFDQIWVLTSFMYSGSVAIAFWIAWFVSGRVVGYIIPAVVLTFISLIIFLGGGAALFVTNVDQFGLFVVPFILITIGVFILFGPVWWRVMGVSDQSKFGEKMEKWGEEFGKSMEDMGKNIEKGFEGEGAEEFKSEPVQKSSESDSEDSESKSTS